MKLLLFSLLSLLFFSVSCQSEYDKQFKIAQDLAEEKATISLMLSETQHDPIALKEVLNKLHHEINDCAHLSGNKRVFLEQLNEYEIQIVAQLKGKQRLFTQNR